MAIRLADGSIQMADGRLVFANSLVLAQDLAELLPLFTPPPAWPFISGGGGGVPGPQGPAGSGGGGGGGAGPQGAQGNQGVAGSGVQGPQGNQGLSGSGVQGPQGNQGNQGLSGSGVQGPQGNQGNQGLSGSGVQGPQGLQGFQGLEGTQGNQGNQGAPADLNVRTIVASDAILTTDDVILADASAGALTATLPDPTLNNGRVFTVKKIDATVNTVTIAPFAAETIDGMASASTSSPNESISFLSDGTDWWVI